MLKEIKYVFSKEYKEDTDYYEFILKMRKYIKLNCPSESVDDKVQRLKDLNFISNCNVKIN